VREGIQHAIIGEPSTPTMPQFLVLDPEFESLDTLVRERAGVAGRAPANAGARLLHDPAATE
jgi:hypothetical protein